MLSCITVNPGRHCQMQRRAGAFKYLLCQLFTDNTEQQIVVVIYAKLAGAPNNNLCTMKYKTDFALIFRICYIVHPVSNFQNDKF